MRRSLQPIVVLVAALVVVGVLAALAVQAPPDDSDPSSRSAGKLGTLALYTWLGSLGLDARRVSGGFTLPGADVLVEYDPTIDFSAADLRAIAAFMHGGGDLILVTDAGSVVHASALLQRLGVWIAGSLGAGTAVPAQPFVPADDVRSVPTGPGFSLREEQPLVPLMRQRGAVVAGAVSSGAGRAYVLGDSLPLSNEGLRRGDSAYLFLGLLARAAGGRIAFDEVHHGEGGSAGGVAGIFEGPIGVSGGLAAALVLAALALNGRRVGRAVTDADDPSVPSATTYVAAMGDLFARSRQRGTIAARYADELKRRVGERTGISPQLDDDAFVAALAATGAAGPSGEIGELLHRARALAAAQPDERALLRLARDVAVAEQRWAATPQWRP